MDRAVCMVFAKPPVAGRSKTRLAAAIGAEAASALALAFLRDTVEALRAEEGLAVVLSTPEPERDHGVDLPRWDQGGGELGERLERSFQRAFREFRAAIALGADSPGLPAGHLRALRGGLERQGSAIGPADDGGFWGLGLRSFPEGMLLGVPWSSPEAAAATAARLRSRGLSAAGAPRWWDIDRASDLERLRREVPRAAAPATHAVLDGLGWR